MKPLPMAKPGGVEATNPKGGSRSGLTQQQGDEVPRGGSSIKGDEGQISR